MSDANITAKANRLLTEPLSIFVLVAVVIFGYNAMAGGSDVSEATNDTDVVVIDDSTVEMLTENFAWLEGREPTAEETQTLISHWIDEEVLFREALAQQMHLSDSKMRAHLIEKVRMLWAGSPEPADEAELLDFYMENMESYYTEPTLSFTQVYFEELPADTADILARLQAGEAVEGEPFWLGQNLNSYSESILRSSFGGEFYEELKAAPVNQWIGPVESARGYHFAQVTRQGEPELMPYQAVRERLGQDWSDYHRRQNVSARTKTIKERFTIVMESTGG
ncbi:MAG: peptidylprolyl isomerase [Pseudohongiella sp.]|uniref:peptidylprolyl isomerase n=1 Tax=Pseudohongiella sp. TaxID=1979412 RepID=UPI00349FE15C